MPVCALTSGVRPRLPPANVRPTPSTAWRVGARCGSFPPCRPRDRLPGRSARRTCRDRDTWRRARHHVCGGIDRLAPHHACNEVGNVERKRFSRHGLLLGSFTSSSTDYPQAHAHRRRQIVSPGSRQKRDSLPARRPRPRPTPLGRSSTISWSFFHCASSVRMLPSSVEAKPHCGLRQNCSSGANLVASSIRLSMALLSSRSPVFEVTSPSTTRLSPRGRNRSGSKPPARSVSYSRK